MSDWKQTLLRLGYDAETKFDDLKGRLEKRLGGSGQPLILPYLGHTRPGRLYLKGRLLADNGLMPASDRDTLWDNMLATYRRLESDEIPQAALNAGISGQVFPVTTDEEGYFTIDAPLTITLAPDQRWHTIDFRYQAPDGQTILAQGECLLPAPSARFGVISDIDDTVLVSHATNLLRAARLMFLSNAHSRLPFAGVAAFYQALQAGVNGTEHNPIFYVSSSPWNLYDLLTDFMAANDIPRGPLFLRDYGLDLRAPSPSDHHGHKLKKISHLLDFYPDLPFILIGDSGQHDPEIYHEVVKAYPGRIQAIYIRDVSDDRRDAIVEDLAIATTALGTPMHMVPDTVTAAIHAVEQGFILATALTAIQDDKEADQAGEE